MSLGFAGFKNLRRRAFRAPVNPYDKCTIVSIFPREIVEEKITLQPGHFKIPAGSYENPGLLVVGPSSWWRDVGDDEPLLEISHSSPIIAESIINDWRNGLICVSVPDSLPGVFWLPGEVTLPELQSKYKAQLDKYRAIQMRYYENLIKLADSLWARTNGNPLSIPDDAKLACRELNLQRDWTGVFSSPSLVKCVACGSLRNPEFPICPTCKAVVDPEKAKKFNLKFAE